MPRPQLCASSCRRVSVLLVEPTTLIPHGFYDSPRDGAAQSGLARYVVKSCHVICFGKAFAQPLPHGTCREFCVRNFMSELASQERLCLKSHWPPVVVHDTSLRVISGGSPAGRIIVPNSHFSNRVGRSIASFMAVKRADLVKFLLGRNKNPCYV